MKKNIVILCVLILAVISGVHEVFAEQKMKVNDCKNATWTLGGMFEGTSLYFIERCSKTADITWVDIFRSALSEPVRKRSLKKLEVFASNYRDENQARNAIIWQSIVNYRPKVLLWQMEKGAPPNGRMYKDELTHLEFAAKNGMPLMVKILLKYKADPNYPDSYSLHYGAGMNLPTAKLLVEAGAKVNVENKEGKKPIDFALVRNKVDIFEYLVAQGATQPSEKELKRGVKLILKYKRGAMAKALADSFPVAIEGLSTEQQASYQLLLGASSMADSPI